MYEVSIHNYMDTPSVKFHPSVPGFESLTNTIIPPKNSSVNLNSTTPADFRMATTTFKGKSPKC